RWSVAAYVHAGGGPGTRARALFGHGHYPDSAAELVGGARRPRRCGPPPAVDPHVDPVHAARNVLHALPRAVARGLEADRLPVGEIARELYRRRGGSVDNQPDGPGRR